jgi:hypothetical protein
MENVKEIFPELYKLSKSQTVRIYASNMTYPPSVAGLRHLNLCPLAQMFLGGWGVRPQSNELSRGSPELVQHSFIEGVHIGARALHVLNLIWFRYIARLPSLEEGDNFLVQMYLTCHCYA